MRSTFGRARVTQTVRPCLSSAGILAVGTNGRSALRQPSKPSSRPSAGTPACRSQAATPWLSLAPFWQITTAERPANSPAQSDGSEWERRMAPGMRRGLVLKSSSVRTSTRAGQCGVPIRRANLSMEMVLSEGMMRPLLFAGRDSSACRLVGRSHSPWRPLLPPSLGLSSRGAKPARRRPLRPLRSVATSAVSLNRDLPRRWPMRAETQKIVDEIKQSVALLRRHL